MGGCDESDRARSDGEVPRASRRRFLAAGVLGSVALTGCSGDEGQTPTGTASATDAQTETGPGARTGTTTRTRTQTETETETVPMTDVHVSDYGATPDDDTDDTRAIRDAFADAPSRGARVIFEAGTYRVEGTGDVFYVDGDVELREPIFELHGYEHLEIRGNGATLSARNFAPTVHLKELRGFEMRDLTVDWDRDLPHTAGTVVADTPEHVDVEVNESYTPRDGLYAVSFIRYDRERERYDPPLVLQRNAGAPCERVSGSVLRCHKAEEHADVGFETGTGIVVRHASAAGTALKFYDCEGVTVRNVDVYSAPGMAINVDGGKDVTVEDTRVVPAPEEGRWQAATRDGFHLSNVRGRLALENVAVEKTGDDAFNFKGARYPVDETPDDRTLVVERPALVGWFEYPPFAVGDEVEIGVDPYPIVPDVTRRLADFSKSATDRGPGVVQARYELTVEDPLPASVTRARDVSVFNATQMPDEAILANSRAAKMRGGGRFMLDNLEVRNCTFRETTGNPMLLQVNKVEGEPANHVSVHDNEFVDASYNPQTGGGLIATYPTGYPGTPPAGTYRDLTFERNRFADIRDGMPAIRVNSASDVTVADNDFSGISGTDPVSLGASIDCDTVHVDGETGCTYYED